MEQLDEEKMDFYNQHLEEVERMNELELDPHTINYQECLLDSFKTIEDPFGTEIESLNYERTQSLDALSASLIKNIVFKGDDLSKGSS